VPHPALIDTVRQTAAATIAALWADARAEAAACRDQANRAIEDQRRAQAEHVRAVAAAAAEAAAADAARQARHIRHLAKAALADRLHGLAVRALIDLRRARRDGFRDLARELPAREWTHLVVHPDDAALAGAMFPGRDIRTDAAVAGGLIAADEALRVDNTLARRLAAAWPELLPQVMKDVLAVLQRAQPVA
jgi:vacuolar-type H+-ATPase subunit E/Vma4